MKKDREFNIFSLLWTLLLHAAAVGLLLILHLSKPVAQAESGVPVMLGNMGNLDTDYEFTEVNSMPAPAPAAVPVPVAPQAEPAIKKSKPLNQGGNKKLLYGGIAAAFVAVIVLIAIFAGGGSPEPETVALPRINYDSLAQERINEAAAIRLEADTIISNHPDDPYDTQYGKVEQIYINALKKIDEALADKDSLSADVATAAQQQQISITNALETVYTGLTEMIKSLKDLEFDTSETEQRVESIKPYVTQTNN